MNCNTYPNVYRYDNAPIMPGIRDISIQPHEKVHVNCLNAEIPSANFLNGHGKTFKLSSASTGLVHDNITEGFGNTQEVMMRILYISIILFALYFLYIRFTKNNVNF